MASSASTLSDSSDLSQELIKKYEMVFSSSHYKKTKTKKEYVNDINSLKKLSINEILNNNFKLITKLKMMLYCDYIDDFKRIYDKEIETSEKKFNDDKSPYRFSKVNRDLRYFQSQLLKFTSYVDSLEMFKLLEKYTPKLYCVEFTGVIGESSSLASDFLLCIFSYSNIDFIKYIIKKIDPGVGSKYFTRKYYNRLLCRSIQRNDTDLFKYLCNNHNDMFLYNTEHYMSAIKVGNVDIMQILEEKGVDINTEPTTCSNIWSTVLYGPTTFKPYHLACVNGNMQLINHLEKKGVNINVTDRDGLNSYMFTASMGDDGNTKVLEHLEELGVDINKRDNNGNTAYLLAGFSNNLETMKYLEKTGVDIYVKNESGFDIFDCCIRYHLVRLYENCNGHLYSILRHDTKSNMSKSGLWEKYEWMSTYKKIVNHLADLHIEKLLQGDMRSYEFLKKHYNVFKLNYNIFNKIISKNDKTVSYNLPLDVDSYRIYLDYGMSHKEYRELMKKHGCKYVNDLRDKFKKKYGRMTICENIRKTIHEHTWDMFKRNKNDNHDGYFNDILDKYAYIKICTRIVSDKRCSEKLLKKDSIMCLVSHIVKCNQLIEKIKALEKELKVNVITWKHMKHARRGNIMSRIHFYKKKYYDLDYELNKLKFMPGNDIYKEIEEEFNKN